EVLGGDLNCSESGAADPSCIGTRWGTAALRDSIRAVVRFGSKAGIAPCLDFVRFTPESGHYELISQRITVGATVEPVAPCSFSGCMTNANSKARALARSSRMSTTRQRCAYIAAGMAWLDVSHLRIEWRQRPARSVSSTTPREHASSMQPVLDNSHVGNSLRGT